jgi:hypothetical protein
MQTAITGFRPPRSYVQAGAEREGGRSGTIRRAPRLHRWPYGGAAASNWRIARAGQTICRPGDAWVPRSRPWVARDLGEVSKVMGRRATPGGPLRRRR